jgi:hypothetical protein
MVVSYGDLKKFSSRVLKVNRLSQYCFSGDEIRLSYMVRVCIFENVFVLRGSLLHFIVFIRDRAIELGGRRRASNPSLLNYFCWLLLYLLILTIYCGTICFFDHFLACVIAYTSFS